MNENTGNSGNEFFYDLLDNPAGLSHSNAFNLQLLVNDYPQSGLLRAMLAVKREEESIKSASAYVSPKLLYKIAHAVGSLRAVSDDQIAVCEEPNVGIPVIPLPGTVELPNLAVDESNYFHVPIDPHLVYEKDEDVALYQEVLTDEDIEAEVEIDVILTEDIKLYVDDDTQIADGRETEEQTDVAPVSEAVDTVEVVDEPATFVESDKELVTDEEEVQSVKTEETAGDAAFVKEDYAVAETTSIPGNNEYNPLAEQAVNLDIETGDSKTDSKPIPSHLEIDDEIFEEIVSIEDIGLEQLALMGKSKVVADSETEAESDDREEPQEAPAGDSYFVFEPTLPEDEEHPISATIVAQGAVGSQRGQKLSKYNDEKMPYSFMWWLDKTRKEHAAIYQPFAAEGKFHTATVTPAEKLVVAADHLQQQYVENIFAVSAAVSDLNVAPPKAGAPPTDTKADKIIEKFIHEEPQIKHPSKVKLDNENKAKKSSEDRDELVTETLAKIYTEQMLYHKALLTYKKLMLKFPEKSLYFAGQIEQLENKIN